MKRWYRGQGGREERNMDSEVKEEREMDRKRNRRGSL
ncbi:hypothetical protein Pmani_033796, partial [Petrolisthes manimaculis]